MSKKNFHNYNVIYGRHACLAVLQNQSREIFEILLTEKNHLSDFFLQKYQKYITITDNRNIEKITHQPDKHQGMAIKAGNLIERIPLLDIINKMPEDKLHYGFILDRIQDPQNIGAIIRSAYCFGASFIMLGKHETPIINNTIIRSSAGFSEVLPIYTATNIVREIKNLKDLGFWILGLDNNKVSDYPCELISKYGNKIIFVLGSEGEGMKELTKVECDAFVKIPIIKNAESLNVSNASSIIAYEAYKIISQKK